MLAWPGESVPGSKWALSRDSPGALIDSTQPSCSNGCINGKRDNGLPDTVSCRRYRTGPPERPGAAGGGGNASG